MYVFFSFSLALYVYTTVQKSESGLRLSCIYLPSVTLFIVGEEEVCEEALVQ